MRVGHGVDVHRFDGAGPLTLGGVIVDEERSVAATSDGDVAVHAIIDALLGAAALGDLGTHFPSTDPRWEEARSLDLLATTAALVRDAGHEVGNIDVTIIVQSIRLAPHRAEMRRRVSEALGVDTGRVSVKATTTDHLGLAGRDEGIAAIAVATLAPS